MYGITEIMKYTIAILLIAIVISSCSSSSKKESTSIPQPIPQPTQKKQASTKTNLNDACDIYRKKPEWLIGSLQASRKWQVPIFVMLAFVYQESHFVANARPLNHNKKIKKKYASSAYGYAQALDNTWKEYQQKTGVYSGKRNDFSSAVDFMGWYIAEVHKRNKVSKWATDKLYLNYHEGIGGYKRQTYKRKPWLIKVSAKVQRRGSMYAKQLKSCGIPLYIKKNGRLPQIPDEINTPLDKETRTILRSKGTWF